MKRIITTLFVVTFVLSAVSAYNPPAGAEKIFNYSSPSSLSGNMTVAGGGLFASGADSLIVNPALSAEEQRVNLNLAYTFLHNYGTPDFKIGSTFQTAILIPFKMFVFSGYVNGTFLPFEDLNLGNSINIKAGLAKEITDKLDVGLSIDGGVAWNDAVDWSLGANLGFNYTIGDLGFLKDFRYGVSVLNLGKNYTLKNCPGIDNEKDSSHFPGIATVKLGAGATFLDSDFLDIGMAVDLSTAYFQNLEIDVNAQFLFKDIVLVNFGECINIAESVHNHWSAIPSVGIGVKFAFNVKNNNYFERNGWSKSEMTVTSAYRNLFNSINAYSAGVDVDLGMEDKTPPVIEILDEE